MKKILFILGLFISVISFGQSFPLGVVGGSGGVGGYSTEYQAVRDAQATPSTGIYATAEDVMVTSLVDDGYWARMDLFYVMTTETNSAGEADINWSDPSSGTYDLVETGAGSLTWTSLEGYTGDGTNHLATSYNPTNDATNFSVNDATIGIYTRLDLAAANVYEIGTVSETDFFLQVRSNSDLSTSRLNGGTIIQSNALSYGFFLSTRTASNVTEIYRNGASLGTDTDASTGLINDAIIYLERAGIESFNQISIAIVMDGISDTDATALNTIFETYMDAIGKGVQ